MIRCNNCSFIYSYIKLYLEKRGGNMKYLFYVLALISFSIYSDLSQAQIPNSPTNLRVIYIFTTSVNIKWDDNSNNENGFVIERSDDGLIWMQRDTVAANTTIYFDVGLITNSKYFYRVCAFNNFGKSAYSNTIYAAPSMPFSCSIGMDTVSAPYPFYATNTDSRTQMIYLRREMVGYCNAGYIWQIAFYSNSSTPLSLSTCTIKMQNTTDTVITGFKNTGWTTVYNGSVSFYGIGWKYLNLSPAFTSDINKNLLIEVCFHTPTSLVNNINVRSSLSLNRVWHRHALNGAGCNLDSGTVQQYRPNLQIVDIIDGVININKIPPASSSIEQNYPNPFNGDTKFKFKLKNYGPVTLSIFDVLGRQEVVVFSEPLAPGEYEKIFSLRSHPLPS